MLAAFEFRLVCASRSGEQIEEKSAERERLPH